MPLQEARKPSQAPIYCRLTFARYPVLPFPLRGARCKANSPLCGFSLGSVPGTFGGAVGWLMGTPAGGSDWGIALPSYASQSLNPWEARARNSCRLLSSAIPARRGDIFKPAGWPVFHSSPWKWSVVPKLLKCSITRKTGTGHACSTNLHDHTSLSGHVLASSGVKKLFSCISCSISSPRSPVRQWKCSTIVLQKCMRFSKNYGFFPL